MNNSVEGQLKRQLMFETLLSEISANFINLPGERIDDVIQDTQRRVCQQLGLDFSALWQLSLEDPRYFYQTHVHRPAGGPPLPEQMEAESNFPWALEQLKSGKIVAISTEKAPREAARDRETWRRYGVKSSLSFPLSAGRDDLLFGALSFGTMGEERVWPEPLVKQLELLAQVFANAIVRKRGDYELQEMAESLRKAAQEWQATFDSTPDIIMILDEDLKVRRHNAAATPFFDLSSAEILGRHCHDLMHETKEPSLDCPVRRSFQSGDHQEEERYDPKRHAWYQITSDPILDQKGNVTRIVYRIKDITKRVGAEEKARKQWEHLAHVTRMGIMGELTSSLAHEINQPLTAIQSNSEAAMRFMAAAEPDTDEVCQILEDISRDNTRAGSIILKIRALLKKEPIPFAVLDVNELVEDVLSLLRADSLLRELVITRDFSPELPPVFGDRVQLQQVIINLILNGAAAMKQAPAARRRLVIRTETTKASTVQTSVTDFGTGIAEQNTETLFEPFYTSKPDGMGMGLAISQTIINEHGGTIKASNHSEGGAVFVFTLPVHQGDPA
jgi:two-component system, LuxR family, sensor kinase FixL